MMDVIGLPGSMALTARFERGSHRIRMVEAPFHSLVLPIRRLSAQQQKSLYHIYTKPGQYEEIEADTALEALKLSGIVTPYKILRASSPRHMIIRNGAVERTEESMRTSPDIDAPRRKADIHPAVVEAVISASEARQKETLESQFIAIDFAALRRATKKAQAEETAIEEPAAEMPLASASVDAEPLPQRDTPLSEEEVQALLTPAEDAPGA